MSYSKNYQKVKTFFNMNVWSEERVRNAVVKKWITEEEFKEITGNPY
jgi:uncharacterized XkdX family phage protein